MPDSPSNLGLTLDEISEALEANARGDSYPLASCLKKHPTTVPIGDSALECHYISVDPNGRARQRELVQIIRKHVMNFAIPRERVKRAVEASQNGDSASFVALVREAENLFTDIKNSGEGGELLLFVLAEFYLSYPQVIPKMYLKTNPQMHVHGADGAFMTVIDDLLALFWGESKVYKSLSMALEECFSSIVDIITYTSATDRDLELIRHNLDFTDQALFNAILNYLDIESPEYEKLKMCGICLVAFDHDDLTEGGTKKLSNDIVENYITGKLPTWTKSIKAKADKYDLKNYHLHIFFIPIESAEAFRFEFLAEIGVHG